MDALRPTDPLQHVKHRVPLGKGDRRLRQEHAVGRDDLRLAGAQIVHVREHRGTFNRHRAVQITGVILRPAAAGRAQQQQQAEQMSIFDQNEIVAAAKANTREVELDNDRDAENQNLMDDVYEVMVKGPKNNIEFQRDFIAEGMDMLNSFNV